MRAYAKGSGTLDGTDLFHFSIRGERQRERHSWYLSPAHQRRWRTFFKPAHNFLQGMREKLCWVKILSRIYALFGVVFPGLNMRWRTKNDKYQVCDCAGISFFSCVSNWGFLLQIDVCPIFFFCTHKMLFSNQGSLGGVSKVESAGLPMSKSYSWWSPVHCLAVSIMKLSPNHLGKNKYDGFGRWEGIRWLLPAAMSPHVTQPFPCLPSTLMPMCLQNLESLPPTFSIKPPHQNMKLFMLCHRNSMMMLYGYLFGNYHSDYDIQISLMYWQYIVLLNPVYKATFPIVGLSKNFAF